MKYRVSKLILALILSLLLFASYIYAEHKPLIGSELADEITEFLARESDLREGWSFKTGTYHGTVINYKHPYVVLSVGGQTWARSGVYNLSLKKVVIPFEYQEVFMMPGDRFLLIGVGDYKNPDCYLSTAEHQKEELHLDGRPIGVDEKGFITLVRFLKVGAAEEVLGSHEVEVPKMALLNPAFKYVLDFMLDDVSPMQLLFRKDYAIVRTGASEWRSSAQYTESNAKYGVIDRDGRFVIEPRFDHIYSEGDFKYRVEEGGQSFVLAVTASVFTPSDWAWEELDRAIKEGLVPNVLQTSYTRPITRGEFSALLVSCYEKATNKEIVERASFEDCALITAEKAAGLGLVKGLSEGRFGPELKLTREQAATMLARLAEKLGLVATAKEASYVDVASISDWALEGIGKMEALGVMRGVGNQRFAPKETYTREQAIITILRLYKIKSASMGPEI